MLKGLLIFAILLVGLAIIAVSYIVPNIRVHQRTDAAGDRVNVETPFGSVRVDAKENARIDLEGIPIYPGAERTKNNSGGATIDLNWGEGEKQLAISGADFVTDDSVSTVREWYRSQLPGWHSSGKEMDQTRNGVKRVIAVKERDGRTHIGIAVIGEPAAN